MTLALLSLSLFGCAAQMAFREGNHLLDQGQHEQGLRKLKEAVDIAPGDPVFKASFLRIRENLIANYLAEAERLIGKKNLAEARLRYQQILKFEEGNTRAQNGLYQLDREASYQRTILEAKSAANQNSRYDAMEKLRAILVEQPNHHDASLLLNEIAREASVDAKSQAKPASTDASLLASYKKAISIEFVDASVRQIFDIISRTSGLNFIFDKDVMMDQRTSIFLKNSTVQSAVHFTLLTNQLEQQVLDANTILIYPNNPEKQKKYQEMLVRTFFLANAGAKTVAETLRAIIKSKDIVVDEKLNAIIIRDGADAIRIAEKLIALQDVAEPEVMLEVEVLEIKRTQLMELGVKWPDNISLTPLTSAGTTALTLRDLTSNIQSRTTGVGIGSVTMNAKAQDSDVKILANPRIRARNHEIAKIQIGERVPNVTTTSTATGFISESVSYTDVGLKLDVEPSVFLDNDVGIKINLEVSNVVSQSQTKSGAIIYQLGTRNASTVLRLKDGETQILAGLINNEDRSTGNKIPGLGEFPLIGRLFGSTLDNKQKTEIVLSITPRIIRNIKRPDATMSEFLSGTDTSFRVRPEKSKEPTMAATIEPAALVDNTIASASTTPLAIHAPKYLSVGDTVVAQVSMQATPAMNLLQFTFNVDPSVLEIIDVREGSLMGQNGALSTFKHSSSKAGQTIVEIASTNERPVNQSGMVAAITLRAIANTPASLITITEAKGKDGNNVLINLPLPLSSSLQIK